MADEQTQPAATATNPMAPAGQAMKTSNDDMIISALQKQHASVESLQLWIAVIVLAVGLGLLAIVIVRTLNGQNVSGGVVFERVASIAALTVTIVVSLLLLRSIGKE